MSKIIISETISRRRILSLAAALGLVTPAAILSASDAEAQNGTERRQERTTTANAVINVTDAPAGSIPLTYNDARFSTNTASGTVT